MSMMQAQSLRDTLLAMPLPRLQEYVRLHKDDPYVVTMALSIANDKKKAATAQQGMAGRQPQPTVVDQQIAQMGPSAASMPEDVGIGQLPAQNMQGMAGGGIVAFDGGGEVPRFGGGGLTPQQLASLYELDPVLAAQAERGVLSEFAKSKISSLLSGARSAMQPSGGMLNPNIPLPTAEGVKGLLGKGAKVAGKLAGPAMAADLGLTALDLYNTPTEDIRKFYGYDQSDPSLLGDIAVRSRAALGMLNPFGDTSEGLRAIRQQRSAATQAPAAAPVPNYTQDLAPGMTAAAPLQTGEEKKALPEDKKAPPAAVPTAVPQVAAPRLNTAGIAALPTDTATIADELKKIQPAYPTALPEAQQKGIDELTKAEQALVDKNLADIEAEQKNRAPALKDFEKLLNDRKARIEGREKDLAPMALLQAGLSIMAGTSPYALVNVGAGATVGMEAYRKGADKLEEARDKMDEGFAKIEEVRRNESRMDAKELRQARMDAMRPQIEAKKLAINALNENWKLSITQATNIFNQMSQDRRTFYEQASQNVRAQLQADTSVTTANINAQTQRDVAGMPGANERLYSRLGNGDVAKGLKLFAESMGYGGDKTSLAALKDYTGPLGEAKLKKLEQGTPEERLTAMQIRNKLKELGGIGRIAPVNVDNALP